MPDTRQARITDPVKIKTALPTIIGKRVSIILKDQRVIIGDLKEITQTGIILRNMRLKNLTFPIDQIFEIYYDTVV